MKVQLYFWHADFIDHYSKHLELQQYLSTENQPNLKQYWIGTWNENGEIKRFDTLAGVLRLETEIKNNTCLLARISYLCLGRWRVLFNNPIGQFKRQMYFIQLNLLLLM